MKRELGKWQFGLKMGWRRPWTLSFTPYLDFWLLKLLHFPPEGERITKCCYSGILISHDFLLPMLVVTQKTFRFRRRIYLVRYPAFSYYWQKFKAKVAENPTKEK